MPWCSLTTEQGSTAVWVKLLGQLVTMWSINVLERLDTLVGPCTICSKWKTSSNSLYCLVLAQPGFSKSMFMSPVSISIPSQLLLMVIIDYWFVPGTSIRKCTKLGCQFSRSSRLLYFMFSLMYMPMPPPFIFSRFRHSIWYPRILTYSSNSGLLLATCFTKCRNIKGYLLITKWNSLKNIDCVLRCKVYKTSSETPDKLSLSYADEEDASSVLTPWNGKTVIKHFEQVQSVCLPFSRFLKLVIPVWQKVSNPCRHNITIVSDFDEQFSRSVGKLLQNYVVAGDLEALVSAVLLSMGLDSLQHQLTESRESETRWHLFSPQIKGIYFSHIFTACE